MKQVLLNSKLIVLALFIGLSFTSATLNAQSPADDPGISGPGSPNNGPAADGSPVVPFDTNMTLLFAASGIAFATLKLKKGSLLFN